MLSVLGDQCFSFRASLPRQSLMLVGEKSFLETSHAHADLDCLFTALESGLSAALESGPTQGPALG